MGLNDNSTGKFKIERIVHGVALRFPEGIATYSMTPMDLLLLWDLSRSN
jgi:hypothetical protein